jgi:tetratricopeptide (TPR) repeat protein
LALQLQWQFGPAETSFTLALTIYREIGLRVGEANALQHVGITLWGRDRPAEAKAALTTALAMYREIDEKRGEANVLVELGKLARDTSDLEESDSYLENALGVARDISDHLAAVNALRELTTLAHRRQDLLAADYFAQQALALCRQIKYPIGEVNALRELGELAMRRGDLSAAEQFGDDALALARAIDYQLGVANSSQSLGRIAAYRHDFDVAEAQFHASLDLYRTVGDRLGESGALDELGGLAADRGNYVLAEDLLRSSLAVAEDIGHDFAVQNVLHALSDLARLAGHLDRAYSLGARALALTRKTGNRLGEVNALVHLGSIEVLSGKLDEARVHLLEAQAKSEEIDYGVGAGNALRELAEVALRAGDLVAAERFLTVSLTHFKAAKFTYSQGMTLGELARVCGFRADQESNPGARRLLRSSALAYALDAVRTLEGVRSSQGSAQSRVEIYRRVRSVYLLALELAASLGDGRAALEVSEAARADGLAAVLRRGPLGMGGPVGDLLARIRVVELDVADIDHGTRRSDPTSAPSPVTSDPVRRQQLVSELEALYRSLAVLTSTAFAAAYSPPAATGDPESVRAGLSGVHILLYEVDDRRPEWTVYCTWVPPQGEPRVNAFRIGPNEKDILARYGNRDPHLPFARDRSRYRGLAQALLPTKLQVYLASRSGITPLSLLVVPSGPLWALPWAALPLQDGRPLVAAASIVLTPSVGVHVALAARRPAEGSGALVCVGAHEDLDAGPEVVALREWFGDECESVDPRNLTTRLSREPREHTVITAVHGQPPEHASVGLDHYVDLGGGLRLRAADLLTTTLGSTLTLGTCFIASAITGPGEEPLSLPTAALCAGANSLTAGIFAIPDRVSADLLAIFYRGLAQGQPAQHALRDAQISHLMKQPSSPLSNWAGIATIGRAAPDPS